MGPRLEVESGLVALAEAAERLLAIDPERFRRVLALALAYLAAYDRKIEGLDDLLARCDRISPRAPKASA